VGRLGHAIFAGGNGAGAVGSVAIVIIIDITRGDRLPPRCAILELYVVDIDTRVNDVDIDTFATIVFILILVESAKGELGAVADTCETLNVACR
jgi:hypothetical protein